MQIIINGREITLDTRTTCSSGADEASWLAATRHSFEVHCRYEIGPSLRVTYSGQDTRFRPVNACMYMADI